MSNEEALSRLLAKESTAGGDLTLELSGLAFIDSSGVRALLAAARGLAGRGRLVLAGARPGVRRVLDLMGVDHAPGVVFSEQTPTDSGAAAGPELARRDARGDPHPVRRARCSCGCPYLYAADDFALFWEPGPRFSTTCTDRSCQCHTAPLRG